MLRTEWAMVLRIEGPDVLPRRWSWSLSKVGARALVRAVRAFAQPGDVVRVSVELYQVERGR